MPRAVPWCGPPITPNSRPPVVPFDGYGGHHPQDSGAVAAASGRDYRPGAAGISHPDPLAARGEPHCCAKPDGTADPEPAAYRPSVNAGNRKPLSPPPRAPPAPPSAARGPGAGGGGFFLGGGARPPGAAGGGARPG